MSGIMQKVKDVISGDSHTNDPNHPTDSTHRGATGTTGVNSRTTDTYGTGNTTAGPHRSDVGNKLDPRVDSDRGGARTKDSFGVGTGGVGSGTGMAGGFGTHHGSTNYGPHDSNIANKLDPHVDSDHDGSRKIGTGGYSGGGYNTTTGLGHDGSHPIALNQPSAHHTTVGPHSSDTANKLDPRVDSDRDGSHNTSMYGHAAGTHHDNTYKTTAGPHSSDMANKLDPRVDSDRDGSHNTSMYEHAAGTHHQDTTHKTTAGPHSSDMANKLDPRVDSDRTGSHNTGILSGGTHASTGTRHDLDSHGGHHPTTTSGSGLTGTHHTSHSTNAGPHSSNVANKLDPRFDSDRDHRGATGTHHGTSSGLTGSNPATGPAPNTAGPHKSDLLNKLDPRVDSDLDGSKTIGGNKTFSNTSGTGSSTTKHTTADTGTGTTGRYA